MRRKYHSHEPNLIEVVIDLAWARPFIGTITCTGMVLLGWYLCSIQYSTFTAWTFAAPLMGISFFTIGIGGLGVGAIALLRDAFFGP